MIYCAGPPHLFADMFLHGHWYWLLDREGQVRIVHLLCPLFLFAMAFVVLTS